MTLRGITYTDQDTLVLEVDIGDGELVGERHFWYKSWGRIPQEAKEKRSQREGKVLSNSPGESRQ